MKHILITIALLVQYLCLFSQSSVISVKKDSFRIRNGELIIENKTKNVAGVLYNTGNGNTEFRRIKLENIGDTALAIVGQDTLLYSGGGGATGRTVQFRTGISAGFPADGDSVYINPDFVKRSLKVWRNGLFQYRDPTDGIVIDSAIGKITFRPSLTEGERVYIEAISGLNLVFELPPTGFFTNLKQLLAGAFNHGNTSTLRWATNNNTLNSSPKIAGIGSSTLSSYLLTTPERLGDKIINWLNSNTTTPEWTNLAVAGSTSASLMPVADGGISGRNIESALSSNPDFIFISLPSNDVATGISNATVLANYRKMDSMALSRGVPVFWQTTQPRTACTAPQQTQLKALADSIRRIWPTRFVESFSNIVDPAAATDAVIKAEYALSDGVHLNNLGVQQIANSLFSRWKAYFKPLFGVSGYQIESSSSSTGGWSTTPEVITTPGLVKKTYDNAETRMYYRVKANYTDGSSSPYSNIVTFEPAITIPNPTNGNPNRILVDLGGDGVNTTAGGIALGKPTITPDTSGNYWNNWYGSGGAVGFTNNSTISNLVTGNNTVTPISLKIIGNPYGNTGVSGTNGINGNGVFTGTPEYPTTALQDNMFVHSSINPAGVILRIEGLSASKHYSIKLWGGRIDGGANAPSRILETSLTDTWASVKTMETLYGTSALPNINRAIVYSGLTGPVVNIYLRTGTGSVYAHLSLIDIRISEPVTPPEIAVADATVTLPNNSVALTGNITPNGNTITKLQWVQVSGPSVVSLSTPTAATCTMGDLTNGTFVFRLSATITGGAEYSDDAIVTVYPDNNGLKTMRVHFSSTAAPVIPGWMNAFGNVTGTHIVKTDPITNWIIDNVSTGDLYWKPLGGNNAIDKGGAGTKNNSGVVPDLVLESYWYNNDVQYTTNDNLWIRGLDPAKTYTIKMVGSRSSAGAPPRWAVWRINGGAQILQNAYLNTSLQSTTTGVVPDGTGKIRIAVYRHADDATYGLFSFINALIIQEE